MRLFFLTMSPSRLLRMSIGRQGTFIKTSANLTKSINKTMTLATRLLSESRPDGTLHQQPWPSISYQSLEHEDQEHWSSAPSDHDLCFNTSPYGGSDQGCWWPPALHVPITIADSEALFSMTDREPVIGLLGYWHSECLVRWCSFILKLLRTFYCSSGKYLLQLDVFRGDCIYIRCVQSFFKLFGGPIR